MVKTDRITAADASIGSIIIEIYPDSTFCNIKIGRGTDNTVRVRFVDDCVHSIINYTSSIDGNVTFTVIESPWDK